ncbi:MAG: ribonuclease D [Holosporales bacterium]|jgi:ribonuclease D|nr:ribonuclease D [Holosporales bacterium]
MNILLHKNDLPDNIEIDNSGGCSVAIDTETMGLMPHRDRLCLLQLKCSNSDVCHLIQFENFKNSENLKSILADERILKIFHYARFDMTTIYQHIGVMPKNVYCTKIASKLSRTYTNSHSLLTLCQDLLGILISKEETCTDWGNSNLTELQKQYAATDVLYLHEIKNKLDTMLKREGRTHMAEKCFNFLETRVLLDLMTYESYDIFSHSSCKSAVEF